MEMEVDQGNVSELTILAIEAGSGQEISELTIFEVAVRIGKWGMV